MPSCVGKPPMSILPTTWLVAGSIRRSSSGPATQTPPAPATTSTPAASGNVARMGLAAPGAPGDGVAPEESTVRLMTEDDGRGSAARGPFAHPARRPAAAAQASSTRTPREHPFNAAAPLDTRPLLPAQEHSPPTPATKGTHRNLGDE